MALFPASGGGGSDWKILNSYKVSANVAAATTASVTVDMPADATEVLAIIPTGLTPDSSWNNITGVVMGQPNIANRTITFNVRGTQQSQAYVLYYTMIYK